MCLVTEKLIDYYYPNLPKDRRPKFFIWCMVFTLAFQAYHHYITYTFKPNDFQFNQQPMVEMFRNLSDQFDELTNYVKATEKRVILTIDERSLNTDLRQDSMERRFYSRFEFMEERFNIRFELMEKRFDLRFKLLEKRFDKNFELMEEKTTIENFKFIEVHSKIDNYTNLFEQRCSSIDRQIVFLHKKINLPQNVTP